MQTFLQNCYLHEHFHHRHQFKQSLILYYFVTSTHCNFQLFLYYACECSIIPPRIILLKLQFIILKILPAY